jgi:hypothetical protein
VQILSFFMFVVMAVIFILAVGYGLSFLEGSLLEVRDQRRSSDLSRDVLQEEDPKAEGEIQT